MFSLSAMLFVFQACYGTPQDFGLDVLIEGTVKAEQDGLAVPHIKVSFSDIDQYTTTDDSGRFSIYCPRQSSYQMYFKDEDGELNKLFTQKDTLFSVHEDTTEINLNILIN